jgi:hypothetical protein
VKPAFNTSDDNLPVALESVRMILEDWRNVACVAIYRAARKAGSIEASPKAQMANKIERRAAKLVRQVDRLLRLHDQGRSQITTLRLPSIWTMSDLERIMTEVGATSEDRPPGINDKTGRRPPLEF